MEACKDKQQMESIALAIIEKRENKKKDINSCNPCEEEGTFIIITSNSDE